LALRKKGLSERESLTPSLFEHLYGYDPIRILADLPADPVARENRSRAVPGNPHIAVINPETSFALAEIASDLPPEQS
jgi:hypothetical protein